MSKLLAAFAAMARIASRLTPEERAQCLDAFAALDDGDRDVKPANAEESAADRRKRADRERKAARKAAERSASVPRNEVRNSADHSAEFRSPSLDSPSPDSEKYLNNSQTSQISEKNPESVTEAGGCGIPQAVPQRNSAPHSAPESVAALPAPVTHAGTPRDILQLREAFASELGRALGQRQGFPIGDVQNDALIEAIKAHAEVPDGADGWRSAVTNEERLEWLRKQVPQFAAHQAKRRREDAANARFYQHTPKCFLNWLNATPVASATFPEASSGTRRAAEPARLDFAGRIPVAK